MKKIINDPNDVVKEYLDGFLRTRPDLVRVGDLNCVVKKSPAKDKVGLVSLGGSGHEPAHAGYIGLSGLDGVACGQVFASPSVEQIYETAKAVETGAGILFIVKNYKGDNLNTDMAMEMLAGDDIDSKKLVITDDVAPVEGMEREDRRGVAGTVLVHQILGSAARGYNGLDFLHDLGTEVNRNLKTMGLALSPCIIPSVGKPNFSIPTDKATIGIGIHGEEGVMDSELKSCDEHTDDLLNYILADFERDGLPIEEKGVLTLVNGMGSTTPMELYIVNRRLMQRMDDLGIKVLKNLVGNYMTSLEMAGFSITILRSNLEIIPFVGEIR